MSSWKFLAGEQCEMTAKATGQRCRGRAYAKVSWFDEWSGDPVYPKWVCGAHQSVIRNSGATLLMVEKYCA